MMCANNGQELCHGAGGAQRNPPVCLVNGLPATFPVRLYAMIEECERTGLSAVVAWQPHGRCFVVRNRDRFVKDILPAWFSMTRYPSFQRQLNLYGFQRITKGPDKGSHYHPYFIRGEPVYVHAIRRQTLKGQGPRKPDSEIPAPDFWRMESVPQRTAQISSEVPSPPQCGMDSNQDGLNFALANYNHARDPTAAQAAGTGPLLFPEIETKVTSVMVRGQPQQPQQTQSELSIMEGPNQQLDFFNDQETRDLNALFDNFLDEDGEANNCSALNLFTILKSSPQCHASGGEIDLEPTPLPPC